MKDKLKRNLGFALTAIFIVAVSLVISFCINNFSKFRGFMNTMANILQPIIIGAVFAFLFAPVFNKLVALFSKKIKKRSVAKGLATTTCFLMLIAITASLILMLIPDLTRSITNMVYQLPNKIGDFQEFLEKLPSANPDVANYIAETLDALLGSLMEWGSKEFLPNINKYIASVSSGVMTAVNIVFDIVIGVIVMMYLLNMKDLLAAQAKKICYGMFPLQKANVIISEAQQIKLIFSKFIVGKIIDSAIIGVLTFIVTSIFSVPYALLISVFIRVTNVIPFFGPVVGAIPCAILLLLVSPIKCLQFLIMILVIQQLDGNIIGPKILGKSIGISSFWVLFSILLFGGLFGFTGMVIGVPTFSVIYRFISIKVNSMLEKKKLSTSTLDYFELNKIDEDTGDYIK